MFDINKVSTIITVIKEGLNKQDSYRIICEISDAELHELYRHFNITEDGEIYGKKNFDF